jgi:excisionase family DNA binding protein
MNLTRRVFAKFMKPIGKKPTLPVDVDESAVLTLHEVADYLHCSYATVYRLARGGDIPGFRPAGPGGDWRFLRSDVDKWIATQQVGLPPPLGPKGKRHR